jgi:starch phosphorylase
MPEALETWNEDLFRLKLPRIHMIIKEINERFCRDAWQAFPGNWNRISKMSIIGYGQVRMANLCAVGCHSINGVSKLHSEILTKSIFKDFYAMYPERFCNVTNGIAHRRWLCYSNPQLANLLDNTIGTGYRHNPEELSEFAKFADDSGVLSEVRRIKHENKIAFADYLYKKTGKAIDTHSLFDVHIKRLHEYKRQLLNVMNIIGLYLDIKENPDKDFQPQTFLFGAKAAPGYYMAKNIIKLIYCLGKEIENDPVVRQKLAVVFLEDYNVTLAEHLIPAAEISEQISLAGKEASGTGCMKLMINGAMTIGTLDGANIEMLAAAGKENMYIFGLTSSEVDDIWLRGYNCAEYYANNERLKRIINALNIGFAGVSFSEIANYLLTGPGIADPYMCMADFESYHMTRERAIADYQNKEKWNRMSLMNIASAGYFAADRSIHEYARNIWDLKQISDSKIITRKS